MKKTEKNKNWEKPIINVIDLKETESGSISATSEGSWWIFTWGS